MKNQFSKTTAIVAICFAALLAAAPAGAQIATQMRFNVPFAFLAGDRVHPAGDYVVRLDGAFRAMYLRPANGDALERVPLNWAPVSRKQGASMPGVLRFRKYGSAYALRGVWATGAENGFELKLSSAEKELARASGGATAEADAIFVR